MSKTILTITDAVNDLMFIAISKPDHIDIDIMYDGHADSIDVSVFPRTFQVTLNMTTDEFDKSRLFRAHVSLISDGALQKIQQAKAELMKLIENKREVAA
jgi:hypothetical protein